MRVPTIFLMFLCAFCYGRIVWQDGFESYQDTSLLRRVYCSSAVGCARADLFAGGGVDGSRCLSLLGNGRAGKVALNTPVNPSDRIRITMDLRFESPGSNLLEIQLGDELLNWNRNHLSVWIPADRATGGWQNVAIELEKADRSGNRKGTLTVGTYQEKLSTRIDPRSTSPGTSTHLRIAIAKNGPRAFIDNLCVEVPEVKPVSRNKQEVLQELLQLAASKPAAAPRALLYDLDGDGAANDVVYYNSSLLIGAIPSQGGKINFFVDLKRGINLAAETGVGKECFWSDGGFAVQSFPQLSYQLYIEKDRTNGGDYLRFVVKGNNGIYSYLSVHREIHLDSTRPVAQFRVGYHNDPNSVGLMQIYPWLHHHIGFGTDDTFHIPSANGFRRIHRSQIATDSSWHNPTRGMMAVTSKDGYGVGSRMDYPHLQLLYTWSQGHPVATYEWRLFPVTLKQDETFLHNYSIMLFSSVNAPSALSFDGDVLGLQAEQQNGMLLISSTADLAPGKRAWYLERKVNSENFVKCAEGTTEDGKISHKTQIPQGLSVWRLTLVNSKGEKLTAEIPFAPDGNLASYRMNDEAPRIIPENFTVQKGASEEYIAAVNRNFKTPFYSWGLPAAHRRLKALALVPAAGMREALELEQRFNISCDTLFINQAPPFQNGDFNGQDLDPQTISVIASKLNTGNYDLVILGGLQCDKYLPGKTGEILAAKVRNGLGLIIVNTDCLSAPLKSLLPKFDGKTAEPALASVTIPHPILSGFSPELFGKLRANRKFASGEIAGSGGNTLLAAVQAGKGRIAIFDYPVHGSYGILTGGSLTPYLPFGGEPGNHFDYDYYEYFFAAIARAALWCTGTDAQMAAVDEIRAAENGKVTFRCAPPAGTVIASGEALLHDAFGREISRITAPIKLENGQGTLQLPAPLVSGINRIKLRLFDQKGNVAAFAAHQENVNRGSFELRTWNAVNSRIPIQLDGTPGNGRCRISLYDCFDRLCEMQEFPRQAQWKGEISSKRMLSNTGWVIAEVFDGEGRLINVAKNGVRGAIPHPGFRKDWRLTAAGLMSRFAIPYYQQKHILRYMREMGVRYMEEDKPFLNASEYSGFFIYKHALGGMAESRTRMGEARDMYNSTRDKKYLQRVRDFHNENFLAEEDQRVTNAIRRFRHTVGDWAMIDEDEYSIDGLDYDFSPASINAFRKWLMGQYGSLEALNAQWGTAYKAWNDVVPETLLESRERKEHNHSSYVDHRLFNNYTVAHAWRFYKGVVNREEPGALIGVSGTRPAAPYGGNDYYQLGQVLDILYSYPYYMKQYPSHLAFFRDKQLFPWFGYREDNADKLFFQTFQSARGGVMIFMSTSMVRHDLGDYYATGHAMKKAMAPINRGRGQLITWTERPGEIAVHFSMASKHASRVLEKSKLQEESCNGFLQMLEEANLTHELIATQQIEAGELTPEKYPLLILPCSLAISDKEAEIIRKYVADGGHVLADALPGVMDGHGKLRSQSPLSELFGTVVAGLKMEKAQQNSSITFSAVTEKTVYNHKYGAGRATLLGGFPGDIYIFLADNSGQKEYRRQAAASRKMLLEAAQNAGIIPSVRVQKEFEGRLQTLEFRGDAGETYLVMQPRGILKDAHLQLKKKMHWFDSLNGEYLGFGDTFTRTLRESVILSGLPEIPPEPAASLAGTPKRGEELQIIIPAAPGIRQVFHLEFFAPDGTPCFHYDESVENNGEAKAVCRRTLALNDQTGTWKVTVTDAATGRTAQLKFNVE